MRSSAKILFLILVVALSSASMAAAEDILGRATDPGYIGVGARSLGMGKASVALADDASAIFVNPAGLGRVDQMLFSSMYANLMEEVNYTVGSLTYPVGPGTLALGYLGVMVPGIELYTEDGGGNPVSAGVSDYSSYVLYLSYGSRLVNINSDIMVGANLKSFATGFSASGLDAGKGSGMNLDLGVLYQPTNWFTCGLTQQNLFSGAKMEYSGGIKDDIPTLTKAGMNVVLMGKYGFIASPYKLNVSADLDMDGQREKTLHLGAELWPMDMLALRAGIDQDPIAGGTVSNLTAGVGLRLGQIQFDYAYHTYFDIPGNTTNYFSISFVGPMDQPKPRKGFSATIDNPKDKAIITYASMVKLDGHIEDQREGDKVVVNGNETALDEQGRFSTQVSLNSLGARKVTVDALDAKGNRVRMEKTILKVASYKDVAENYWARKPIELLGTAGVLTGYPDGSFKPERTLTRGELASMLVKAKGLGLPDDVQGMFSDVARDHWAARYIEAAVKSGLVKGYPDKTFKPDAKISKAEGVTVMARLEGLDEMADELKEDAEDSRFIDIGKTWAGGYILAADSAGLLEYLEEATKFDPDQGFTRAEAAEILSKTTLGTEKIETMLAGKDTEKTVEEFAAK